jgi:hypothetical protein
MESRQYIGTVIDPSAYLQKIIQLKLKVIVASSSTVMPSDQNQLKGYV